MLVLARKLNERIIVGDNVEIAILEIKGDQVKLGIKAPDSVKVYRFEVYQSIQEENRAAARSAGGVVSLPSLPLRPAAGKPAQPGSS
jgi:carbon storage regulator